MGIVYQYIDHPSYTSAFATHIRPTRTPPRDARTIIPLYTHVATGDKSDTHDMTYWASGRDPPASVSDVQVGDDPYTAEGVYAQTGGWGRYGGEGESGPSDYARKAWVRGMERRWAEEDEGGDGDAGCWDGRSDRAGASERGIGTDVGTPLQCRGCRCGSGLLDQHGALTESLDRSATRSTRPKTAPRRARRRRTPATGIVVLASGLLPFVSAAPAPAPPYLARDAAHSSRSAVAPSPTLPSIASRYDVDPTPSSASSRHALPTPSLPIDHGAYEISIARAGARADKRDGVKYLTSAEPPTAMPTATMNVPETALPYLLREDSDGVWTRVGEGWKLYGRQVGVSSLYFDGRTYGKKQSGKTTRRIRH